MKIQPSKPPAIGEYYRLPEPRYRKTGRQYNMYGQKHDETEYIEAGFYIVTKVDTNDVTLRLVSKHNFRGAGRQWIKKSIKEDKISHSDFKSEYSDDAITFLQQELDSIIESYRPILGDYCD